MGIPQRKLTAPAHEILLLKSIFALAVGFPLIDVALGAEDEDASHLISASASKVSNLASRHFYAGECVLPTDPGREDYEPGVNVCVQGHVGTSYRLDSHHPFSQAGSFGNLYGSVHLTSALSIHAEGEGLWARRAGDDSKHDSPTVNLNAGSVRFGNRALQRVVLTAGYQDLPFGINLDGASWTHPEAPYRTFWETERLGGYITWQDELDLRLDLGLSTAAVRETASALQDQLGASARIIRAISSLDGTDLAASVYAKQSGERRAGLGILNSSRRREKTAIEWVRIIPSPSREGQLQQIIRVSFTGARKKRDMWQAVYEQVLRDSRSGEVSDDIRLMDHLSLILGIRYTASEVRQVPSHWTFTTGVVGKL